MGTTADVFNGDHYCTLCHQNVEVNGKQYPHKYFKDSHDVALGLSTDGFAPLKHCKHTAWPLIVFNYNLPPEIRFHLENILSLGMGIVPSPNKPKDMDSFLWPFIQEMLRLAIGIRAYDILGSVLFALCAFLIFAFGDIPAISMIMRMKGHNAISPCRMCTITGLRVPNTCATTHYVPLNQTSHPTVQASPECTKVYDPARLPLQTHNELMEQGAKVERATTNVEAENLAKKFGIKGVSILSYLKSLSFPHSFPYNFMHLIWENLIKTLILLWTGEFKGLDTGSEMYELSNAVWQAIGEATAKLGSTIPSAYDVHVPNISKDRSNCSAEMLSFWTLYLGPVLLRQQFSSPEYYQHFLELVRLLNICLQFEFSAAEIEEVWGGFIVWVKMYERIYYQDNLERLSACPLTIHALLHIADSIKFAGPVWCYWAFPMERYCGSLQPAIHSRRFPYASLDRQAVEMAQLAQIKVTYHMSEELALRPLQTKIADSFSDSQYPTCILLTPKAPKRPTLHINSVEAAIATRFDVPIRIARDCVKRAVLEE